MRKNQSFSNDSFYYLKSEKYNDDFSDSVSLNYDHQLYDSPSSKWSLKGDVYSARVIFSLKQKVLLYLLIFTIYLFFKEDEFSLLKIFYYIIDLLFMVKGVVIAYQIFKIQKLK